MDYPARPSCRDKSAAHPDQCDPSPPGWAAAAERLLLQQAAVLGRTFWDASLEYINRHFDPHAIVTEIQSALSSLTDKEILYSKKVSAFRDAQEYNFKHVMLRDVTYESVLINDRKDYHGAAAHWFADTTAPAAGLTSMPGSSPIIICGRETRVMPSIGCSWPVNVQNLRMP